MRTAECSVTRKRWDGESVNYHSLDGARYVKPETLKVKTAYSRKDFGTQTSAMMEVFEWIRYIAQ